MVGFRSWRRSSPISITASDSSTAAPAAAAAERLTDPSHAAALQRGLEAHWRAGKPCDLVIEAHPDAATPGGTCTVGVPVNSAVAAAMSRPLSMMLAAEGFPKKRHQGGVLTLPAGSGVEAAALAAMVEYFYTGKLEVSKHTVLALLRTAGYLELESVTALCAEFLRGQPVI